MIVIAVAGFYMYENGALSNIFTKDELNFCRYYNHDGKVSVVTITNETYDGDFVVCCQCISNDCYHNCNYFKYEVFEEWKVMMGE